MDDVNTLRLTVEDLQLVKLSTGLKVLDSEGDVEARLHFDNPRARLKVGETVAW